MCVSNRFGPPDVLTDPAATERRSGDETPRSREMTGTLIIGPRTSGISADESRMSAVDECPFGLSRLNSDRCCSRRSVIDLN